MINIFIQILGLTSGLLLNFLVPLLFGLEQYGIFIKTNLLVFFFHKCIDLVSEPLLSVVDKASLLFVSLAVASIFFTAFLVANYFFTAGSVWLLGSMLWSNCVLLVMYAHMMQRWVLFYLCLFIVISFGLLFSRYFGLLYISIEDALVYANFLPSSLCIILMLVKQKLVVRFCDLLRDCIKILRFLPSLLSLTLVNNLFTNILPFYLSFVFTPQLLGLFKVQISIAQSVGSIFPVNIKTISTYFLRSERNQLLERTLKLSMNYFSVLALFGFAYMGLYEKKIGFAQMFMLLPVIHASVILERYLLGIALRKKLMVVNLLVSLITCGVVLYVQTINQMLLLYTLGVSLYLFLMLAITPFFPSKKIIKVLALMTPLVVLSSMGSCVLGYTILVGCALAIFAASIVNKSSMSGLME